MKKMKLLITFMLILLNGFGQQNSIGTEFPEDLFKKSLAYFLYLDSHLYEKQENYKAGRKIAHPKKYPLTSSQESEYLDFPVMDHIINELAKQTNQFESISINKTYKVELEYGGYNPPLTYNVDDYWEFIFLDDHRYKMKYRHRMGQVSHGEDNFYMDLVKGKYKAKVSMSTCGKNWDGPGYNCNTLTFLIRDDMILSKKYE